MEQRIRRAIVAALNNLASMGVIDYTNPKFEDYAPASSNFKR
ncbi:DNA-binding domain-containing protein [Bacillus sp. PK3_68]